MTKHLVEKKITPSEVFVPNGLEGVILAIKEEIKTFQLSEYDMSDEQQRDEVASFAYKITRSKTFVDGKGKEYVGVMKEKTKAIDAERKRFRDEMDELRDKVRKPVTDWEASEKLRAEAERMHEIMLLEWDEAIAENDLVNREREMARKEAELAKAEEERLAREKAEQAEKDRIDNEAKVKEDAKKQAEFNASEKIKWAKIQRITDLGLVLTEDGIQWVKDDINISVVEFQTLNEADFDSLIIKVKREIDRRTKKEADDAILAAKEQAEEDKAAAVQKAKDDAEAKAKAEKKAEDDRKAAEKKEADRKAANRNHQKGVNRKALAAIMKLGIKGLDEAGGTDLLKAIIKEDIPAVYIKY